MDPPYNTLAHLIPTATRTSTMSSPKAYSLFPITPIDVDRFASGDHVQIKSEPEYSFPVARKSTGGLPSNTAVSHPLSVSSATTSHPEGSVIYYHDHVVSCQPITSAHISLAQHILSECEEHIAEAVVTVFVKLTGWRVEYYVVVHETKSIAWVAEDMADSFYGANSTKHEYEYWIHMENFPAPYFSTPEDLQLLKNVLASNAIDSATSDGSTSPMTTQQIESHLKVLDAFSSEGDVSQTYAIARLWNMIMQSRVINRYGTPEARLDRFVSISDNPPQFGGTYASVSRLFFGLPEAHLGRCSRAWADRIAYTDEWRKFKLRNEKEWTQVIQLSCVLIIASLITSARCKGFFNLIPHTSLLLALASAAGGYYLLNDSQNLGEHAADASVYFQKHEEIIFGVQRISILNALPQGLLLWSFMFFILSALL